jgi:uncharacterized protein (TIGR03437 family)
MRKFVFFGVALLAASCFELSAQTVDSSANSTLKGTYYLRQLLVSNINPSTGVIGRGRSLSGTATFDGSGTYSVTGTLLDSLVATSAQPFSFSGYYNVGSNGLSALQNPLEPVREIDGGMGLGAFVGSSTESDFQDLFVMIPASKGTVTNAALSGSYRVGTLEFPQASAALVRDTYFTLTTSGDGRLGTITVNGSSANQGNALLTQQIAGGTYSLSGLGAGTISLPNTASASNQLVSGSKTLYLSADGSILLGGSPSGYDLLLGIRAPSSAPSVSGTYFAAGFDVDNSNPANPATDAFYGSMNGVGGGATLWHQRLNPVNEATYDFTFSSNLSPDASGGLNKDLVHYDIGAQGQAFLIVGKGTQYSLALGVHADNHQGSGVFINPLGVVSAASYSPVTSSIAPNEFISIFGSGLAPSAAAAASFPLPTSLGGVQVSVNGRPARLLYVSQNQINALVPFNTPEAYVSIQVTNQGVASNTVTFYAGDTAPGVFTLDDSGIGAAAALHADYSVVNAANPARPGETIQVYLTGLGNVVPPIPDGVAASASPSSTEKQVAVYVDTQSALVTFAGLAPGFAGVYQVNVKLPPNAPSGTPVLSIATPDGIQHQVVVILGPGATSGYQAFEFYRPRRSAGSSGKVPNASGRRK